MTTYNATGYKMVKNQNTWEMERAGELITVEVKSQKNNIEMIEGEVANKMSFDWFEALTIS
jgi:hypothetical protein